MTVLSETRPVARKTHYCDFCGGIIAKGQKYLKQVNIIDGDFGVWKCHEECQDVAHQLGMYEDCDPDYGINDEIFVDEINNYIHDVHFDKTTRDIEADWQDLTTHQQVLKIQKELEDEKKINEGTVSPSH